MLSPLGSQVTTSLSIGKDPSVGISGKLLLVLFMGLISLGMKQQKCIEKIIQFEMHMKNLIYLFPLKQLQVVVNRKLKNKIVN